MKLLFIGRNYKGFKREAVKLGVNRNIAFNQLSGLKWGEEIVCAKYKAYPEEWIDCSDFKTGRANKILSFRFSGMSFQDPRISRAVIEKLDSEGKIVESKEVNQSVSRDCGSYAIASTHTVKAEIEEIQQLAKETAEELGIKKIKVMIGGSVNRLYKNDSIEAVQFSRGLITLDNNGEMGLDETMINITTNYKQHRNMRERKEGRAKREHISLDKFFAT